MSKETLKLTLEALGEILESFEKDGKLCKSSLIRNELFDRIKATFEKSKAIAEAAKQEHGGHEDEEKAAKGQFTTMVEPSIHAGSGEKIGFPHRGQKQEQSEPVAVMELYESGWDLVEDIDTDWLEKLPFGTKLYTTPQQPKPLGMTQEEFENDKGA